MEQETEYTTTWYRWVIVALFAGLAFCSNMVVASFNSLVDPLQTAFGVSEGWIIVMMTMSHIIYAPLSILVSWMFQKLQSATVYRIAAGIMLLGSWIRLLAFTDDKQFWILFLGQTTFAFAGPMIFNGLSIVTISWFSESEKATATSLIGFGAQCGSFVGMAIPGVVAIGLDKTDPVADFDTVRTCILIANGFATVICVFFFIFFRGKPAHPPSLIAIEVEKNFSDRKSASWGPILKELCQNKDYICNMIIFIIFWGIQSTVAVILTPLFAPGGYETSGLSLIGVCFVSGGMVFLFVYGIVLDRTKAYLFASRLISVSVTLLGFSAIWIIPAGNLVYTGMWAFVAGSFVLPIFTVALPFTVILTHPIPSDASNGIMMTGSYIFATIGCLGGAPLFEKHWYIGIGIFICCAIIALIASLIMRQPESTGHSKLDEDEVKIEVD